MYKDEFGVQFSDDKKTLIKVPEDLSGEYAIPEGTEKFECNAFEGCTKLHSLWIPSSLKGNVLYGSLHDCEGLQSISVSESNPQYCSKDGILYFKDMSYIIRYPAAKEGSSYVMPKGVKGIASGAFAYNRQLELIQIPESLNDIDGFAFEGCSMLKSIDIPDLTMNSISICTFAECSNLISVHLPNSIKTIAYEAFWGCEKLTSINIPDGIEEIENGAFAMCTAFQKTDTYKQLCEKGYSDVLDDSDEEFEFDDDELGEKIEGDGVVRDISYYENEECLVILHLHVFDDRLQILREIRSMADNGFADVIDVHEKQKLMHVLNVGKDEDVIDALMEKCKTEWCSLDMDKFFNFLESNLIQYNRTKTGDFGVDWSGDEPIIKYYPIKK